MWEKQVGMRKLKCAAPSTESRPGLGSPRLLPPMGISHHHSFSIPLEPTLIPVWLQTSPFCTGFPQSPWSCSVFLVGNHLHVCKSSHCPNLSKLTISSTRSPCSMTTVQEWILMACESALAPSVFPPSSKLCVPRRKKMGSSGPQTLLPLQPRLTPNYEDHVAPF